MEALNMYNQIPQVKMNESSKTRRKSDKIVPVVRDDGTALFPCPVCGAACRDQTSLTRHIRQHNRQAPPQADVTSFTSEAQVQSFKCNICSKILCSKSSLDRHMLVHSGERPYKCRFCDMAFTTNGNMHRHMKIHTSGSTDIKPQQRNTWRPSNHDQQNGSSKRKRDNLDQDYTPASKKSSIEENHMTDIMCPVCGISFASKKRLEEHLDSHPNQPVACIFCKEAFASPNSLYVHYVITHTYQKQDCSPVDIREEHTSNIFNNRNVNINYHFNARHVTLGFSNLNFVDFSCGKFGLVAKDWCEQNKLQVKNPVNSYPCSKCECTFPCLEALRYHSKKHGSHSRYECHQCNVEFYANEDFKNHMMMHTDDKVVDQYVKHEGANDNDLQDVVAQDDFMLVMGLKRNASIKKDKPAIIKTSTSSPRSMPILKKILQRSCNPLPPLLPSLPPPLTKMTPIKEEVTQQADIPLICRSCGDDFKTMNGLKNHLHTSAMCCGTLFKKMRSSGSIKDANVSPVRRQSPTSANSPDQMPLNLVKLESQEEPLDLSMKRNKEVKTAFHKMPCTQLPKPQSYSALPIQTTKQHLGMRLPIVLPQTPPPAPILIAPEAAAPVDMKPHIKANGNTMIEWQPSMPFHQSLSQVQPMTALQMAIGDQPFYQIPVNLVKCEPTTLPINKHQCPKCPRAFPWASSLKRHLLTHTGIKPFRCPYCPVSFTTKSNRARHLIQIHGLDSQDQRVVSELESCFSCDICSEVFQTAGALLQHYQIYHIDCKVPKEVLDQVETDLNLHVTPMPDQHQSPFPNRELCPGWDNSPMMSPVSERSSTSPDLIISKESPFHCHICDLPYPERRLALLHIQTQHPQKWIDICHKNRIASIEHFSTVQERLRQAQASSSSDSSKSGPHKFQCTLCPKSFPSLQDLKRHCRSHTGEQPFECAVCKRRFTLKHSMVRHMKRHIHGEGMARMGLGSSDEEDGASKRHIKVSHHLFGSKVVNENNYFSYHPEYVHV